MNSAALAVTCHPAVWNEKTYLENKHAFQDCNESNLKQNPRSLEDYGPVYVACVVHMLHILSQTVFG